MRIRIQTSTSLLLKFFCSFLTLFTIQTNCWAQEGNWDVYLAQYEKGAGSTTLDMSLIKTAPHQQFPFLVITGVTYSECRNDGFPEKLEFDKLYDISDNVEQIIKSTTLSRMAGTFTYNCERLDYIYVQDTLNLREKLTELYASKFKSYKPYINIRLDQAWEAYTSFLYPNPIIQEYMSNEKVLNQLRLAGDALDKPRPIDHWLYFNNNKERALFIKYALEEKFKIVNKATIEDSKLPYQLHISRTDSADSQSINNITIQLKNKALELNGNYDGWESVVLKD
ncbi:DUF695 domain-containing protein [Rufibacter tibetensis]|uniref:DUF695 domain-containing protein n=1 Tax=Rufibacter tibetensis TaxID=512763 RepID=UPI0007823B16|nr:DUF695 domain-containing protein [Rufibacter tibetensis]